MEQEECPSLWSTSRRADAVPAQQFWRPKAKILNGFFFFLTLKSKFVQIKINLLHCSIN